jgi:hypothetical protein
VKRLGVLSKEVVHAAPVAGYGRYLLGRLCDLAAIRYCIGRGIRTIHLLYGESRHKRDLGGMSAQLASYLVLRTWAALRPGDVAILCWKHLVRLARRSIELADRVAGRGYGRTPFKSFARRAARHAGFIAHRL